ncbi:MAG: LptF/LptG family permease, partial [Myxococcota bacterium]
LDRDAARSTTALYQQAESFAPDSPRGLRLRKTALRRTALPILSIVFAVVGVAAGYSRRWRWLVATTTVLGFYLMMRLGDALAEASPQALALAVWGPLIVVGGIGLWALTAVSRPQ